MNKITKHNTGSISGILYQQYFRVLVKYRYNIYVLT